MTKRGERPNSGAPPVLVAFGDYDAASPVVKSIACFRELPEGTCGHFHPIKLSDGR